MHERCVFFEKERLKNVQGKALARRQYDQYGERLQRRDGRSGAHLQVIRKIPPYRSRQWW
jgi:hypothetical protein